MAGTLGRQQVTHLTDKSIDTLVGEEKILIRIGHPVGEEALAEQGGEGEGEGETHHGRDDHIVDGREHRHSTQVWLLRTKNEKTKNEKRKTKSISNKRDKAIRESECTGNVTEGTLSTFHFRSKKFCENFTFADLVRRGETSG